MKKKEMKKLVELYREGVVANKKFLLDIEVSLRNLRTLMIGNNCSNLYINELNKIIERLNDNHK